MMTASENLSILIRKLYSQKLQVFLHRLSRMMKMRGKNKKEEEEEKEEKKAGRMIEM
jgi:hypothetical protein